MSVQVSAPWNGSTVLETETYGHTKQINTSTGAVEYTWSGPQTVGLQARTRSAKTSTQIVNGWRVPTSANARIVKQSALGKGYYATKSGIRLTTREKPSCLVTTTDMAISSFTNQFANLAASADTQALSRLANQKLELGVSLVEARKSINHLAHTAMRVLTMYRNLRKGNFSAVADDLGLSLSRRSTRNLAKNWLEYSYAWRPLLSDVHAAYGIAKEGLNPPLHFRVSRTVETTTSGPITLWADKVSVINGEYWSGQQTRQLPVRIGVKTILYTKISSVQLQRLQMLGLINPAEIAWELVPWSFVVDWFVPVGTFLSACTSSFGQTFVSGTRTRFLEFSWTGECAEGSLGWTIGQRRSVPSIQVDIFEYARAALTSFPSAKLYGTYSLSTNKVVSAVALWRSLRR